jgi:hypothetical protein
MKNILIGLLSSAFVALAAMVIDVAVASAADSAVDPTKVGDHINGIFSPNAKAIWIVIVAATLLIAGASRRMSKAAGIIGLEIVAGIVIFNPAGTTGFMQGIAEKVL